MPKPLSDIQKQIKAMESRLKNQQAVMNSVGEIKSMQDFIKSEKLKHEYIFSFYELAKHKPKMKHEHKKLIDIVKNSAFRRQGIINSILIEQWNFIEKAYNLIQDNSATVSLLEKDIDKIISGQISISNGHKKRLKSLAQLIYKKEFKNLDKIISKEISINKKQVLLAKKEVQREREQIILLKKVVEQIEELQIHINYQFKYINAMEDLYISKEISTDKKARNELEKEEEEFECEETRMRIKKPMYTFIPVFSVIKLFAHNSGHEMHIVNKISINLFNEKITNIKAIDIIKKEISMENLEKRYEEKLSSLLKTFNK